MGQTAKKVIEIVHTESQMGRQSEALRCVLGKDVQVGYATIPEYCDPELAAVDHDLLALLQAVVFADRSCKRYKSSFGARSFLVSLPVFETEQWREPRVELALREALGFATGDRWEFDFTPRTEGVPRVESQRRLRSPSENPVILPYSGGMDSYGSLKLLEAEDVPFVLVSALTHERLLPLLGGTLPRNALDPHVRLRVGRVSGKRLEPSYRTRVFVFLLLSALICRLLRGAAILVPENGQGALGGALISSGQEYPNQVLHPGFTSRLANFLEGLWGLRPSFDHHNLWSTKAQLIEKVESDGRVIQWSSTISCSRAGGALRRKGSGLPDHCGICTNCLLRRLGLFSSGKGVTREPESYIWQDLDKPSLQESLNPELAARSGLTGSNDTEIAIAAVLAHAYLAQLSSDRRWEAPISRCVAEVSNGLGTPQDLTKLKLQKLLLQHKVEWDSFVDELDPKSWLVGLARGG